MEAARQYCDQRIAQLEALPNRSRREQEQLNTLLLEKRFQQRVVELGGGDDDDDENDDEDHLVGLCQRRASVSRVQLRIWLL